MPLHGKLVVIKRSGGDGTEFPLTAACLFGRRSDCDIRIQLPQVSKEHCRIDLNENKEIILTNLSSSCPTRVNGETLLQSERLKHGDVITVFDRSFRFEYPPAPTPKKKSAKTETLKVLQDQQVGDAVAIETGEKITDVSTDPHLKDGTNHDNIQRSLEKTVEVEAKGNDSLLQSKSTSPFGDLYQMIKQSLDVKTPRKSSASMLQTPVSRFCTPKPGSVRKNDGNPIIFAEDKSIPKMDEARIPPVADEAKGEAENGSNGTPKSVKKQRRSVQVPSTEMAKTEAKNAAKSEATSPQKRSRTPPKRFTAGEVIEQISATPPVRRRSKEAKPAVTKEQEEQAATSPKADRLRKASPRNSEKAEKVKEMSKKRKSEGLASDLPVPQIKKKRVSFGGFLCPELFDKRLPPDSPLCKGATPRRSLCVSKPKKSLLRRASVIGLLQDKKEHPESPQMRTPSPKKSSSSKNASPKATPGKTTPKSRSPSPKAVTPTKKSPKSKSPSPKAATPAKKSPKSRSPSPKAATPTKISTKPRTPSPKTAIPAKNTPKSKSPSPARGRSLTVGGTPGAQTPKVQGRFSVSHIGTPSPLAEDVVTDQVPSVTGTPKISQRRNSTSRETPSMGKSAAKVMHRRSGISRASMKFKKSWADIVRFGQTKADVVAPAKKTVTKKTKKTVSKPQTPARKLKGLDSTGHADSPVSIVVGRAHKLKVVHSTSAAPKLVTNVALFKKNMKMDEDLTGISEMLKTPVNPRKGRSVISEINAAKTPEGTSVVEPSVLNTPEEPGEMMVSPLSISSTSKDRSYNSEAVKRLLDDDDQESSFVSDTPALDDSGEQQCTESKITAITTPKQKPEVPECLTGVKRIMKTPKQKAEPVEDLRGKILKTPKQRPEQQECLTGVKRIMKTPKQKAEPVEDLRGKILKTPKQRPEQQECLTGVKRIMKTPKQKAEPVEDLRGKILKTPKQRPEQQECLTGVKRMMETPKREAEPVEDIKVELLTTPKHMPEQQECPTKVETIYKIPQQEAELLDLLEKPLDTPKALEACDASLDDVKELETLRPTCNAPVEDSEGPQELMEEPVTEPIGQLEINKVFDQTAPDCDEDVAKELDFVPEESQDDVADVPQDDIEEEADVNEVVLDDHLEDVASGPNYNEASDAMETISQAAVDENLSEEQPKEDTADEDVSEEQPKVDTADEDLSEEQPSEDTADEDVSEEQPKVDTVAEDVSEEQPTEDTVDEDISEVQPIDEDVSEEQPKVDTSDEDVSEEQPTEDTVDEDISEDQPKVDTADEDISEDQPKVDTADEDLSEEQPSEDTADEDLSKEQPKVDTVAEDVSEEQPTEDTVDEDISEVQPIDEDVSEEQPKVDTADEDVAEEQPKMDTADEDVSEVQPVVDTVDEDVSEEQPKVDTADEDVSEEQPKVDTADEDVSEEQPKVDTADEDVSEEQPKADTASSNVTEMDKAATDPVHEKKSCRGRRAKTVECKLSEDKQEAAEHTEDPVVPAPVRGRRGKKTEAAAPPAVKKTRRGRNAKPQESTSDDQPDREPEKDVETLVTEVSTEAVSDQTSPVKEKDSTPPAEEAVVKPVRGRKTKQTAVEPEPEQYGVESLTADAQPEKSIPTVEKPRRGRKTKPDTVEQNEVAEDAVVVMETKQQPPVRAKRGRNAKQEEESVETAKSQDPAKKLRRTRKAEQDQSSEDQAEMVQEVEIEMMPEPESKQSPPVDVEQEANSSAAHLEKAASKPRRGRKPKQAEQSVPEQQNVPSTHSDDIPQADTAKEADANEVCNDHLEVVPSGCDDNKLSDVMETDVETATCEVTEVVAAVIQKKPGRGRRAKTVEGKSAEDKQEAAEHTEDPVVPAPVRGRRGKKAETAAPPTVRKMTTGRNAKPRESTPDDQPEIEPEKAVETLLTEVSTEAVSDQTSPVKENDSDSTPPAEEAVVKPVRGRKTKRTAVEPEPEQYKDEDLTADAQPEKSILTVGKPRRGRKTKPDTVEQNEVAEDAVVVETKQQSQPPVRAKRGRNAKQEEESVETTKSQEPATKLRRTRNMEQDHVEPREEAAIEMIVPEEAGAPVVVEPMKMNEQATKPRRGRKTKQDPESETPVEELPAVSATDKAKRGRRGKNVTEEAGATAVVPEEKPEELEAEEKNEPDAPVIKQSRARGAKNSVKYEVSQATLAKRARRGAALTLEGTNTESTVVVSQPASTSVEAAKRGRQAAAKPTAASSSSSAAVEEAKPSKKSVKWKANLEDTEILKATPIKAVRGRKSKPGDIQSKNVSKDADKTEEKDLSDKVVEAQPVKRARRGANVTEVESVKADAQPKTRRGRPAKK